jgi:hypothetical protein
MAWETVTSMLAAATIIGIILISGGARIWVRKRFDVSEHFEKIDEAVKRQQLAKRKLHSVQTK